jgi:hypothetical protein
MYLCYEIFCLVIFHIKTISFAQLSHASYRWTTHKIALAYNVAQNVSNFREYNILRKDNINNVMCLLNEEKEFAKTKPMTNYDVRVFFKMKVSSDLLAW